MFETDFLQLKKRKLFVWVVVVMLIVLLLPTLSRFYAGNSSFVGTEPYYHYRVAGELLESGSKSPLSAPDNIEDLTHSKRDYSFTPFHYLLVYMSYIVSLAGAIRILPLILGILSILVFNLILKSFIDKDYQRHITLFLLIINPAFIYTFTVANFHSAAIFFTLLGFYFFMKEKYFIISLFCFILVSSFSLFNTIFVVLLLSAYALSKKKNYIEFFIASVILIVMSFISKTSLYYNYTFTPDLNILNNLFSDLGGLIGFGIFTIFLAFYGISGNWSNKKNFSYFLLLGIILVAAMFLFGNMINMYIMFFIAISAAAGFVRMYESNLAVKEIRSLTLLILVCGLLFSGASYLGRLTNISPEEEVIDSLAWLGANAFKDNFVLSDYNNGYIISTVARNPVFSDAFASYSYNQRFPYKIEDTIFHSRKIEEVKPLFKAYDIEYIFITPDMKNGGVWNRENEDFLFLLTNRDVFEQVYNENGVEIWRVLSN